MNFWNVFIYCLTGAGAMALALAVLWLVGWGLVYGGGFLFVWAVDSFENRGRR